MKRIFYNVWCIFKWIFKTENRPITWIFVSKRRVMKTLTEHSEALKSKTVILWRTIVPLLNGKRELYASWDPENLVPNSGNPQRTWMDQEYRAYALTNDVMTIVYSTVPGADLKELNSYESTHTYKVLDGTNSLRTHLGNCVVYLRIANGNYPVAWIALDYDITDADHLKEVVQNVIVNLPSLKSDLECLILKR